MYNDIARKGIVRVLRECVTEGTFWNRHFQKDDVIDVWREVNRIIAGSGHEPVSFDAFYLAMQKFKLGQIIDFEKAVEDAISFLEKRPETVLEERKQGKRPQRRSQQPSARYAFCRSGRRASKDKEIG